MKISDGKCIQIENDTGRRNIISSKKNFMTDRSLHQICNKKHFLSRSRLEEISLSETNLITVV